MNTTKFTGGLKQERKRKYIVSLNWAYPSSEHSKKFKKPNGCWIVTTEIIKGDNLKPILTQSFDEYEKALTAFDIHLGLL